MASEARSAREGRLDREARGEERGAATRRRALAGAGGACTAVDRSAGYDGARRERTSWRSACAPERLRTSPPGEVRSGERVLSTKGLPEAPRTMAKTPAPSCVMRGATSAREQRDARCRARGARDHVASPSQSAAECVNATPTAACDDEVGGRGARMHRRGRPGRSPAPASTSASSVVEPAPDRGADRRRRAPPRPLLERRIASSSERRHHGARTAPNVDAA